MREEPRIPPDVVEAMTRVEVDRRMYGHHRMLSFSDPELVDLHDFPPESFLVGEFAWSNWGQVVQHHYDRAVSVAAQALAFLAWLETPDGKAWSEGDEA